jgi:hypothetical protein
MTPDEAATLIQKRGRGMNARTAYTDKKRRYGGKKKAPVLSWREMQRKTPPVAAGGSKGACAQCNVGGVPLFRCAKCIDVTYCGADCQRAHWKGHKKICGLGRPCDGCQQLPGLRGSNDLSICPDCDYAACDDCSVHGCTANTTIWGANIPQDGCRGIGRCGCGSCDNELGRQLHPKVAFPWNHQRLPPFHHLPHDVSLHHNLARGTCRCPTSNFGRPYADMGQGALYRRCYHGAKGGAAYVP